MIHLRLRELSGWPYNSKDQEGFQEIVFFYICQSCIYEILKVEQPNGKISWLGSMFDENFMRLHPYMKTYIQLMPNYVEKI